MTNAHGWRFADFTCSRVSRFKNTCIGLVCSRSRSGTGSIRMRARTVPRYGRTNFRFLEYPDTAVRACTARVVRQNYGQNTLSSYDRIKAVLLGFNSSEIEHGSLVERDVLSACCACSVARWVCVAARSFAHHTELKLGPIVGQHFQNLQKRQIWS